MKKNKSYSVWLCTFYDENWILHYLECKSEWNICNINNEMRLVLMRQWDTMKEGKDELPVYRILIGRLKMKAILSSDANSKSPQLLVMKVPKWGFQIQPVILLDLEIWPLNDSNNMTHIWTPPQAKRYGHIFCW